MSDALLSYAQAFRLQSEGRIQEAEVMYEEVILHYPDSSESEYARIQLDNLRRPSDETTPPSEAGVSGSRPSTALAGVAFALSAVSLVLACVLLWMVSSQKKETAYQKSYLTALIALQSDDRIAFLRNVADVKALKPGSPEGYVLAADFFIKNGDEVSARKELKACPVFGPEIKACYNRIVKMKKP